MLSEIIFSQPKRAWNQNKSLDKFYNWLHKKQPLPMLPQIDANIYPIVWMHTDLRLEKQIRYHLFNTINLSK